MAQVASSPFQLDTSSIVQLLGSEDFYDKNPVFLHLKKTGLKSVEKYQQAVLKKRKSDCDSCGRKVDERIYVVGVISRFVEMLKMMKEEGQLAAQCDMKAYLSDRLGYPVDRVRLYYASKESDEKTTLEF